MTSTGEPTLCLVTAAALSVQLQEPLVRVRQALGALRLRPALTLNSVEHFDEPTVYAAVRQWLAEDRRG